MNNMYGLLGRMIDFLAKENNDCELKSLPNSIDERLIYWRELINKRNAKPIADSYLALEDEFLSEYMSSQKIIGIEDLVKTSFSKIMLYDGNIINLKVDAIVNAANSEMLGCFIPNHNCIDNVIHTFAGYRLKLKCLDIMTNQGVKEPIGRAKITPAYHLPASYVIHTVGPKINENQKVSRIRIDLLKKSYLACLNLAKEKGIETLAFCCISTGQFGFPKKMASEIAVNTVKNWLIENDDAPIIVFNTYTKEDKLHYKNLLLGGFSE